MFDLRAALRGVRDGQISQTELRGRDGRVGVRIADQDIDECIP